MSRCVNDPDLFKFQSPRRWGGVGLPAGADRGPGAADRGFNPLGGGAGSGSYYLLVVEGAVKSEFQSPRRWGGVGLRSWRTRGSGGGHWVSIPSEVGRGRARFLSLRTFARLRFGFNPLGGGAGSGS